MIKMISFVLLCTGNPIGFLTHAQDVSKATAAAVAVAAEAAAQ